MKNYPLQTPDQLQPILAAFRKTAGLTQAELAVRLGVTQQTYSAAERNAANMSVAKLMAVLNALDVELVLQPKSVQTALAPSNQPTAQW
ncbi:transcriptional regulator [Limnohabitans sp. 2KL-1]|uniref:helix-turn-helix domain-containing protein n=1 Tax=Limnohabitans sp. 2KL-1 TaxID=1100699 RepID=UPI000D38AC6C|nr:helix-turn-helix transcriptional regulator [Limnohabitans sp. 2KL-1]PUE47465.1 transcriptional regulator [Limnohabitans sp. 2KL-1]